MNLILLATVASFVYVSGEIVRYDNYSVYRITPKDVDELKILQTLRIKPNGYDFWTEPRSTGLPVDIMVPPERKIDIEKIISENKLIYKVIIKDVQNKVDEETRVNALNKKDLGFGWNSYYTVDEIYDWLKSLASQYPDKVKLEVGGSSYEGRDILGVKVSFGPGNENKSVWIDSLIHAREWISGATTTYILNQVLTSTDPDIRSMAESHDWYFFPVINPDGYEFSHTTARYWRKTRKPYGSCEGTDPNRNWGYKWNQGGASNDPCSEAYAGPKAFSDIETYSLSKYITGVGKDLLLFISFHSFSQLIVLPYGHTTEHLDNYNVTYEVGLEAAKSLAKRYNTKYYVGNIAETVYVATGTSMDWVKANFHVPFVYSYELRDTGEHGFMLPPEQIIPTGEETLDSIVTILKEADNMLN